MEAGEGHIRAGGSCKGGDGASAETSTEHTSGHLLSGLLLMPSNAAVNHLTVRVGRCQAQTELQRQVERGLWRRLCVRFAVFYVLPALALLLSAPFWLQLLLSQLAATASSYGGYILGIYAQMFHHLLYGFQDRDVAVSDSAEDPEFEAWLSQRRQHY